MRRTTRGKTKVRTSPEGYLRLDKRDHRSLALWAARCAARVLPLFEEKRPRDLRPRKAIEVCRAWARGEIAFSMRVVRDASLSAHAAARGVEHAPARAAARAAGQAVGTLHVPEHACAAVAYAVVAAASADAQSAIDRARAWQMRRFPKSLRRKRGVMSILSKRLKKCGRLGQSKRFTQAVRDR